MKILTIIQSALLVGSFGFMVPAIAGNSTWDDDEMSPCKGLTGEQQDLCQLYCDDLHCDDLADDFHCNNFDKEAKCGASASRCQGILIQWNTIADGEPMPCEEKSGISLVKTVNTNPFGLNVVGSLIKYSFSIMNTGNKPLQNIVLTDPSLTGSLSACQAALAVALPVGSPPITCSTDATPGINARAGVVENSAKVKATSQSHTKVTAHASTCYIGVPVTCPDSCAIGMQTALNFFKAHPTPSPVVNCGFDPILNAGSISVKFSAGGSASFLAITSGQCEAFYSGVTQQSSSLTGDQQAACATFFINQVNALPAVGGTCNISP